MPRTAEMDATRLHRSGDAENRQRRPDQRETGENSADLFTLAALIVCGSQFGLLH